MAMKRRAARASRKKANYAQPLPAIRRYQRGARERIN